MDGISDTWTTSSEIYTQWIHQKHKSINEIHMKTKTYFIPGTAPTAPNAPESPSIILASHSTWPSSVKLEPWPAFVLGSSFNKTTKATSSHLLIYIRLYEGKLHSIIDLGQFPWIKHDRINTQNLDSAPLTILVLVKSHLHLQSLINNPLSARKQKQHSFHVLVSKLTISMSKQDKFVTSNTWMAAVTASIHPPGP